MERRGPCILCRGTKMLCGLAYCPSLVARKVGQKLAMFRGQVLEGSTPPSVYVSWRGYPYVRAGPAAPPVMGDTALYETPERWLDLSVNEVLEMRLSMVRGLTITRVKASPLLHRLQEIALSSVPVEVEMSFSKPPRLTPLLDSHAPPLGPGGIVEKLRVLGNPKVERPVEKVYGDTDLPATEAMLYLYEAGVPVSAIQRLLSVGALGVARRRKLVPTRWSITAVDDAVSRALLERVRELPPLSEYLFFERRYAKNLFVAIVAPGSWSYEWIEAWFPRTTWNRGDEVEVEGDWEGFKGRSTYASLGGCYYAARLATAEYMLKEGRQGIAVLIREIYEGFDVPIGVWFVRENVRRMFRRAPEKYDTLTEVLQRLDKATQLPLSTWLRESRILRKLLSQRRLSDVLRG